MTNINKQNELAIEELSKDNDIVAQTIFRKNIKTQPCCLSLNNLGVYYSQYGMTLRNGRIQSAKKVGLNYLLKASLYGTDWRNFVSVATALLESGAPEHAYHFLLKAHALNPDFRIIYNIGACLFRLERFREAEIIYETLCTRNVSDQIVQDGGQDPLLILAYCKIKLHNKQECMNYIHRYRDVCRTGDRLDVFHLRYLCGMYEEALSECLELLEEWYPTKSVLALIIECISYFPSYASKIEHAIPPDHKASWNTLENNVPLRMKKIEEYSYVPPTICLYQYII